MATTYIPNSNALLITEQASSTPASMKEVFRTWVSDGNAKKLSPQVAVACLDRISEYVINKKISCSIWDITKPSLFKPVYQKVLEAKLLRIMEKNTHKAFTVVGQLYLRFLKEKPWEQAPHNPTNEEGKINACESRENEEAVEVAAGVQKECKHVEKFMFKKEVDWSLFNYGFTIPQSYVKSFCANLGSEVPRGGSYRIILMLGDKEYFPATLSNVGFSSESRQQWQVRYGATSPIATKLREIFKASYNHFVTAKNNSLTPESLDDEEYAEVMCEGTDTYALVCFPSKKTSDVIEVSPAKKPDIEEILNPALTIKEAVVHILNHSHQPLTAKDIYNRIISNKLYSFGAQDPVNVVRNTIEYACENSGYANRNAKTLFRREKNNDGKRVYSLLENGCSLDMKKEFLDANVADMSGDLVGVCAIWNSEVEQAFQEWLENGRFSLKTADIYRRAVAQVYRNYVALAQKAMSETSGVVEATKRWITLLGENRIFQKENNMRHHQFTSALCALEQFHLAVNGETPVVNDVVDTLSEIMVVKSTLSDIVDLEEGKSTIREILAVHFQTLYGYSNINILWNTAQDSLSLFLNDNAINSADELWRFMYRVFLGEYVMSNPHIWKSQPNYPRNNVGIIINLARQLGGIVTREQIDEYFARIKQASPINATILRQGTLMFYAPKHFIISEAVNITSERCSAITNSLARLFEHEKVSYIVLRDIAADWFSSLPAIKAGTDWTALLLQEVLRLHPNIGYRVIFSGLDGQALDTLGAAIVPSQSDIHSFADVVHRYCYEQEILGKRMVAEDLRVILRDAGMLEGNELIYNLHKALKDYRFAFTDENRMVKILER